MTSSSNSSDVDLRAIAAAMNHPLSGVPRKDRRYRLKIYKNCFIGLHYLFPYPLQHIFLGREAVTWLMDKLSVDRIAAVEVGQRLVDLGYISHVVKDKPFLDDYLFYRFMVIFSKPLLRLFLHVLV